MLANQYNLDYSIYRNCIQSSIPKEINKDHYSGAFLFLILGFFDDTYHIEF